MGPDNQDHNASDEYIHKFVQNLLETRTEQEGEIASTSTSQIPDEIQLFEPNDEMRYEGVSFLEFDFTKKPLPTYNNIAFNRSFAWPPFLIPLKHPIGNVEVIVDLHTPYNYVGDFFSFKEVHSRLIPGGQKLIADIPWLGKGKPWDFARTYILTLWWDKKIESITIPCGVIAALGHRIILGQDFAKRAKLRGYRTRAGIPEMIYLRNQADQPGVPRVPKNLTTGHYQLPSKKSRTAPTIPIPK